MIRQSNISDAENLLLWVRRGMPVHDRNDHHIGRIKSIHFGQDEMGDHPTLHKLHDLPPELQEVLTHDGFIEIDTGFLSADLLAKREQLEEMTDEYVKLSATREELIKP